MSISIIRHELNYSLFILWLCLGLLEVVNFSCFTIHPQFIFIAGCLFFFKKKKRLSLWFMDL